MRRVARRFLPPIYARGPGMRGFDYLGSEDLFDLNVEPQRCRIKKGSALVPGGQNWPHRSDDFAELGSVAQRRVTKSCEQFFFRYFEDRDTGFSELPDDLLGELTLPGRRAGLAFLEGRTFYAKCTGDPVDIPGCAL